MLKVVTDYMSVFRISCHAKREKGLVFIFKETKLVITKELEGEIKAHYNTKLFNQPSDPLLSTNYIFFSRFRQYLQL